MFKNKRIIRLIVIVIIVVIIFFLIFKYVLTKFFITGNNRSSQEIVDYILSISSYKSEIDVEIKSNKNTNKYKINQIYIKDKISSQEIVEPSNLKGISIIKENNDLQVKNSNLNLVKIIKDYKEVIGNNLDLITFIDDYKTNSKSKYYEQNSLIVMETVSKSENIYNKYETLYIDKDKLKPIRLEIKDTNQNTIIYIIYNDIKINEVDNENIYAFKTLSRNKDI